MAEVGTYRLHPALLDMATGSAMFLIKGNETAGYLYVPISYGRVYVSGQLPPTCYAYIRSKAGASIENPVATFDVTILDREGNAIVEISDFSVRQVRDLSLLESAKSGIVSDLTDREMIRRTDAITSEEGSRVFARILANPEISNVIVFPSDFSQFRERSKPKYNATNRSDPVPSAGLRRRGRVNADRAGGKNCWVSSQ